jgi:hypothetical protein
VARGDYPKELSKTDPLRCLHVKIPLSTIASLNSAAGKRARSASYVIREILMDWALEYRKSGPGAEYKDDAASGSGKRKRA